MLRLWFLGAPRIELDNAPVEIPRSKALALLVYLAITGEPQQRDTLATMFWAESSQSLARASLRRDLSVLNKALPGEWLLTNRETIGLRIQDVWIDVREFRECLSHPKADLETIAQAVALYHDHFLAGFSLPDSSAFDDWQYFQMEALRQQLFSGLRQLVMGYRAQADNETALHYAQRWLSFDGLHEAAHRAVMELYARTGQKAAAIRQYEQMVQILRNELGTEPDEQTVAAYQHIRTSPPTPQALTPAHHNLPTPATTFIGHTKTLDEISQRLADPNCRLLTLTGAGGIGKTRLAIQVAHHLLANATAFIGGIYYVPLVSLSYPSQLINAMTNAMSLVQHPQLTRREQLLNALRQQELLLVLDNFEHLIAIDGDTANGTDILAGLLAAAPRATFLVTSREALNLQEEWVYPVEPMRYPTTDALPDDLASYSAVQLFARNAQRARPDFSLTEDLPHVLKICQLVEGIPLAIELAAAWLKVLPTAQIATEIEQGLDLLTTNARNVPNRHRSMRAVFEQSWQLLDVDERTLMQKLSVFRGGFRQQSGQAIAGTSLVDLANLVEKSLLQVTATGRYRIHELLRQFISEKPSDDTSQQQEVQATHSHHYLAFLQTQQPALTSKEQHHALKTIGEEIENVRAAWAYAVAHHNIQHIETALTSLYLFYKTSSRFQEGEVTFRHAANQLQANNAPSAIMMKLWVRQGVFSAALGMYRTARELLEQATSLARQLQADEELIVSLDWLGKVIDIQGETQEASLLYHQSLAISREIADQRGIAASLYNLGWIAVRQGHYPEAQASFTESLALYREIENQDDIGHTLYSLGMTAFFMGEYATAETFFIDSLNIVNALGNRYGTGRAIAGLGLVAWGIGGNRLIEAKHLLEESLHINREIAGRIEISRRLSFLGLIANDLQDHTLADRCLQESLTIAREIGFTFGIPWALSGLGRVALGRNDLPTARTYLEEAVKIALDEHELPIVLDTLVSLVAVLHHSQATTVHKLATTLNAVINHHATWQIIKDRAHALLTTRDRPATPTQQTSPPLEHIIDTLLTQS